MTTDELDDYPRPPVDNGLVAQYKELAKFNPHLSDSPKYILIDHIPYITKAALDKGVLIRYFARQTNHTSGEITEITEQQYNKLRSNPLYKTLALKWKISGQLDDVAGPPSINTPTRLYTGVMTANQMAVVAGNEVLPGLVDKLTNLQQFYQR